MNPKTRATIKIPEVILAVVAAGLISQFIAQKFGHLLPIPIREPINLALIFLFTKTYFGIKTKFISPSEAKAVSIVFGALIGGFLVMGSWQIAYAFGALNINWLGISDGISIMLGFILLILHALSEELLPQKFLRAELNRYYSPQVSILLTALVFPLVQALQGYFSPILLLNSLLMGLLLSLSAQKFGYWAAVLIHAIWSWLELIVFKNCLSIAVTPKTIWFGVSDSYDSVSLTIVVGVLLFALSLFHKFDYKAKYDTQ